MQKRSRIKEIAGFTIFEVAIAGSIMALVLGSSLSVIGRGFAILDSARCINYSAQIMQSELERMRLTTWGDGTAAGNGSTGVTSYPKTLTTVPLDSNYYSAGDIGSHMTMKRIAEDVHAGMIKITLTISWTTTDRRAMSRSYVTYYGKNGLYDLFTY